MIKKWFRIQAVNKALDLCEETSHPNLLTCTNPKGYTALGLDEYTGVIFKRPYPDRLMEAFNNVSQHDMLEIIRLFQFNASYKHTLSDLRKTSASKEFIQALTEDITLLRSYVFKHIFHEKVESDNFRFHSYDNNGKIIHVDRTRQEGYIRHACAYTFKGMDYLPKKLSEDDYDNVIKMLGVGDFYNTLIDEYDVENTGLGNPICMKPYNNLNPSQHQSLCHSSPDESAMDNSVTISNGDKCNIDPDVRLFMCHDVSGEIFKYSS